MRVKRIHFVKGKLGTICSTGQGFNRIRNKLVLTADANKVTCILCLERLLINRDK